MANGALDQGMAPQGAPQGQPPQGAPGPQGPPQGEPAGPQRGELYPKDKKELATFVESLLTMIYDEEKGSLQQIVKTIQAAETVEEGIANVVSMLLVRVFTMIRKQKGADINTEFVDDIIILMIKEMYAIAKSANMLAKPPPKETFMALVKETMTKVGEGIQTAVQEESQMSGAQPQGGPPPGPPQGQPQPPSALGA